MERLDLAAGLWLVAAFARNTHPPTTMYKIIGADGLEYGPATADQIRRWISEGRANAQTKVQRVGTTDWVELRSLPEFADALAAAPMQPPPEPHTRAGQAPEPVPDRDYVLNIDECIAKGWQLLQSNFGTLFLATLVYVLIQLAMSVLGMIPFVGVIVSLGQWVVTGPLVGGLLWVFIQTNRAKPATTGDVFAGFGKSFLQLVLGQIVPNLLASLCLIPAVIVALITILPAIKQNAPPDIALFVPTICVIALCAIPMTWLNVNWMFTIPLVIDKGLNFWPAMSTSWRMVTKHWWRVFAVVLLVGVFNLIGVCLCCVGVLFTLPLTIGMIIHAYETIFCATSAPSAG